jgi:hypothetical protein
MSSGETDNASVEAAPPVPIILHEGRYRLYKTPDGGMRLQYQRDDKDTEDFIVLPAVFVSLADSAARGDMSAASMVKAMMSFRP